MGTESRVGAEAADSRIPYWWHRMAWRTQRTPTTTSPASIPPAANQAPPVGALYGHLTVLCDALLARPLLPLLLLHMLQVLRGRLGLGHESQFCVLQVIGRGLDRATPLGLGLGPGWSNAPSILMTRMVQCTFHPHDKDGPMHLSSSLGRARSRSRARVRAILSSIMLVDP